MLVPKTELGIFILLAASLVCWGVWASTLKLARKWRFEHYYYDFTLGVVLAVVAAAFTAGSWDPRELTFQDNFLLAGYRKMAWSLGSGVVFNLGNLLLLGAMTTGGMTLAFPVTFGLAWAVGAMWMLAVRTDVNGVLAVSGAMVMIVAAVLNGLAYAWYVDAQEEKRAQALRADPRVKRKGPRPKSPAKGIALAAIGGLVMSVFFPALAEGTSGADGVSAYGAALLVAVGIFGSTIVLVPFFLNFPVQGEPAYVSGYFKGSKGQHGLGLLGGLLWAAAVLLELVPQEAEGVQAPVLASYLLTHAGPLLAALLGVLVWREYAGSPTRVRMMLVGMFLLFLAGIGLIGLAPVYGVL